MNEIPKLDKKGLRKFGLLTGLIALCLFGLGLPWLFDFGYPSWPWFVCGILSTWALIAPRSLNPVYKIWMRIGLVLGWVMNRVILAIVFFVIFMPVGWLMCRFSGDPMKRQLDKNKKSYRIEPNTNRSRKMERPF